VRDDEVAALLRATADAVADAIVGQHGRGLSGERAGQYHADVVADAAAVQVLTSSGMAVVSEESGETGSGPLVCVIDPIDGSTNFDRGLPFYATSLCVLDHGAMRCALVVNQATGTTYEATRGRGATRDGTSVSTSGATTLAGSIIGFSGLPASHGGWAQYRAFGSAALEICAVADGSLDGYAVVGSAGLRPWDYLGAMLILKEAHGTFLDAEGAPLVEASRARRRPVAGASDALCGDLLAFVAPSET
jgi:myo-inositol-1(or 4)-monophosphatase